MLLKGKIRSVSDVITNSSSEIFTIRTEENPKEVAKFIQDFHTEQDENNYSGCGGCCDVQTWEDRYENYKHIFKTPEEWAMRIENATLEDVKQMLWIDIDWACENTIDMIRDEFEVVDFEVN